MAIWQDEQAASQENLQQAFRVVIQRQLAAFLALTLAFIVPLSCDHHGMMNLFDLDSSSAMYMGHAGPGQTSPCDYQHSAAPGISMSLLASAGLTPSGPALTSMVEISPHRTDGLDYPAQPDPIPPDQPPRWR